MTADDMLKVIEPKSDQINADDLIGQDMVVTISGVKIAAGQEQPVSISFEGSDKVYRPCKSMSRVLVAVWGPDSSKYVGRALRLYNDPEVTWAGMKVGGIRIREMSHMDGNRPVTLAITEKRGSRRPALIKPLVMPHETPAERDAKEAARAAARGGKAAFEKWWNSPEGKAARPVAGKIVDELKSICASADAAAEGEPFGLPPVDPLPTPEEIEAAQKRVDEELARRDAEYTEKEPD